MDIVVVKHNEANKPMHYGPYTLGNVTPPDECYVPHLFSHHQATKEYNQIDRDIYESRQKSRPADRKKTPKSVLYGLALAGVATAFFLIKKFIFKK